LKTSGAWFGGGTMCGARNVIGLAAMCLTTFGCDRASRTPSPASDAALDAAQAESPRPPTGGGASAVQPGASGGWPWLEPTPGDPKAMNEARDALVRKRDAGTASAEELRMLRAMCRRLEDRSCM